MENRDRNVEDWVEDRIRSLNPSKDWHSDAVRARALLNARGTRKAPARGSWVWALAAVSAICLAIMLMPARGTCAQGLLGLTCAKPAMPMLLPAVVISPRASFAPAVVSNKTVATKTLPAVAAAPPLIHNYKASGSVDAPIVCEIYSDYECPHCANFYAVTLPALVGKYVKTGKMRLLHRDFPLPSHRYALLAARYANAAGELGFYDVAVARIFRTQAEWSLNGDVDVQVAEVVSADVMKRLRQIVTSDASLDDTVRSDVSMALSDSIDQTPTLVIVHDGRREKVPAVNSLTVLESYLDQMLAN